MALRADSPLDLRRISLFYDYATSDASALKLLYALQPEWEHSEGKVELVHFTDGITNTLLKAVKRRPGRTEREVDQEAVLLRAYGKGTAVLIDRERETRAHLLLASRGLAPPLLARFDNGLLYRYIEGDVCTPEDLRRPQVWRATARVLGQWHRKLPISAISSSMCKDLKGLAANGHTTHSNGRPFPNLWTIMDEWIDALPKTSDKDNERRNTLHAEAAELSAVFGNTPGLDGENYIFSHCDLLSGNVIVQPPGSLKHPEKAGKDLKVCFIDYEYATPAPAAFDIANHFAEWAGFDCDHTKVPTRSQRQDFLSHYVSSYLDTDDESVLGPSLKQLTDQIELFRGIPGFYWGIWALVQAQISQIDFDYASYAEQRFGEYYAWKAEADGSRVKQGREMGVREKRWASD